MLILGTSKASQITEKTNPLSFIKAAIICFRTRCVAVVKSFKVISFFLIKQHGRPIKEKPFCSIMIIWILHNSFFGLRLVVQFDHAMYTSNINEGPRLEEKELPPSMVALAATAVRTDPRSLASLFLQHLNIFANFRDTGLCEINGRYPSHFYPVQPTSSPCTILYLHGETPRDQEREH